MNNWVHTRSDILFQFVVIANTVLIAVQCLTQWGTRWNATLENIHLQQHQQLNQLLKKQEIKSDLNRGSGAMDLRGNE